MEIGHALSNSWPWSSRELEDKPSSSSTSSVAVAKQTSILVVDIVWTILILGFFLGAAYLIKRSRHVCYTVSASTPISRDQNDITVIGRKKPHDHLTLEINNNLVQVDSGPGHAGLRLESSPSPSCPARSASSVGSNLSSFWGSHHALVDLFRLSSTSAKVASSSSMVGQTASVTLHEFDVSPSCRSTHDEQAGFALKGRSKRILRTTKPCGGGVDSDLEELALSFPPRGTCKHGGSAAAAGLGVSRGYRRFRDEFEGEGEAEGVHGQMYYHEIHDHEDLEENNTRSEITLYDAPTPTDLHHGRVNRGGLQLSAFRDHLDRDEYERYERSVEGDREQQHHHPGPTQSRVRPQGQRSITLSRAINAAAASKEPSCPSNSQSKSAETAKSFEGPGHGIPVHYDNNSNVTQLQSNLLDYGQFHFSDPDLNDWWRPRA